MIIKNKNLIYPLVLIGMLLMLTNSCKKDEDEFKIGNNYQGGIIAYILQEGDPGYEANVKHGIIAAISDQSSGIQWYNGTYTTTGAIAYEYGTGNANTNAIVASQGEGNYAAKLCQDLVLDGYTDWYLPTSKELEALHVNQKAIGGFSGNATYWSSYESDYNDKAWGYLFIANGTPLLLDKNVLCKVRAVRVF